MTAGESAARATVAANTLAAVHRRDHHHTSECCAPHCVETVHLGGKAAMVCHDCGTDSGFLDNRAVAVLCREHAEENREGSAA